MQDQKNKKNDTSNKFKHLDMDTVNAGSSMECTGLIPFAVKSEDERNAYKEIYDFEADDQNYPIAEDEL